MLSKDEVFISRCLQLAKNGIGNVAPNPMVGSVIVYKDRIIGEGFHKKYGEAHAEVNAINAVQDQSLLKESTIYVNLEPCAHYGKTPPCADLIAKHKIPRVIIGTQDPFAKVSGKGIKILEDAGCEVKVGILEKECYELNKRFFTFQEKRRPYIILKWAQTIDGFIDVSRDENCEAKPTWITNENTRVLVHKWRSEEDSIMVGTQTALNDNPGLDTRDWVGSNPVRIVLDKNLRLPLTLKLFNETSKTIIFTAKDKESSKSIVYYKLNFEQNLTSQILHILQSQNIQSVIIEGGRMLLQTFIDENLWDEARYFIGNTTFNRGIEAPRITGSLDSEELIGKDRLIILKNAVKK